MIENKKEKKVLEKREMYDIYTDLALEEREKYERNVEIPGVVLEKKYIDRLDMVITQMVIQDKHGVKAMGKPQGTYITIESRMFMDDEFVYEKMQWASKAEEKSEKKDIVKAVQKMEHELSMVVSEEIKKLIRNLKREKGKILVAGLGNENATPDALGPLVVGMIDIKENVICITPGVLAQTGIETYKIIKGIIREERPDLVIAVDSLAARNTSRVATTVQITDTGIIPGSGIGNHRKALNQETLEIPVIAVGVPMVVNSVTIVHDTMEHLLHFFEKYDELKDMTEGFSLFNREEKYQFIDEIMSNEMGKMYVTPKDVDDIIGRISRIIARAINFATV